VHEYNTEILALVYLPYHSTPQFLALLSILPSSPPPTLRFLFPYIASLSNPPRQTIVYTAVNTPAFFVALQGYVVKALQAGHHSSGLLSFWSGVTTQAIDAILDQWQSGMKTVQNQRREELLIRILPTLNEALKFSGVAEAVMGCYMIIIILVTKGAFEDKVLDALMEAVVRSQEPETLEDCLICLAVVAEERSQASLPRPVAKRLLKTPQLTQHLRSLSTECRVERLALGSALATLENKQLEERRQTLQEILVSNLLDDSQTSHILSAALHLLRISSPGSAQHGQLIDCITQLNEVPAISQVLQPLLKGQSAVLGSLGLLLDQPLAVEEESHFSSEDEVMLDADQDVQTVTPPSTTVSTFLGESSEESFQLVLAAFEQAVASASHPAAFLAAKELGQAEAFKKPLYLSFLGRAWCSHTSTSVRIAALKATILQIRKLETGKDLQNLIPYLICALADRAPTVRRAAAVCVSTLAERTSASQDQDGSRIWGSSDLYGKASPKIDALAKGQTANLLSSLLVPILEECVMDSGFILSAVKEALGGGQSSKSHSQYSLKKFLRDPLLSFLGSHVAVTPSLPVRLCLLPLFAFSSKAAINLRTNTIVPLIRGWCSLSAAEVKAKCTEEKVTLTNADNGHFTALIPRESETIDLVRDILLGNANRDRTQLLDTTFDWLKTAWSTLRSTARLALSECLLDLTLKDHNPTAGEEFCRTRSLELLRNVNLDTDILLSFTKSIPSTTQMPEGPAKKRRRTSRSEMARIELRSTEDVSRVLGRLTMVLELLEASNPGEHPALFKDLFTILGDLQQLRQQSGSDLVYLQSLILGALTPMVNKLKVGTVH
jgi:U3 small nucleolar RNA-associated protein 10